MWKFFFGLSICILSCNATAQATPSVDDVKVTILSDMIVSRWTHGEWGFSALVEVKSSGVWKKLLFDTGAEPTTVIKNAHRLKINLCDIPAVVLSHNHQDHTMGLVAIRKHCLKLDPKSQALAKAYVGGPEFFYKRPYAPGESSTGRSDDNVMVPDNGIAKALGIDSSYELGVKTLYERTGGQFVVATGKQPMLIPGFSGVWMTGSIPRVYDEKTYPEKPGILDTITGQSSIDLSPEDQALVIHTSKGLIVLTGCAHSGLVNTVLYAHKMLGSEIKVHALLGGFHLLAKGIGISSDVGTLAWTAEQLSGSNLGIQILLGAHCTGFEALKYLRDHVPGLNSKTAQLSTINAVFSLESGIIPTKPSVTTTLGN